MKYKLRRWRDTNIHVVTANLNTEVVRPTLADTQFPFLGKRPVNDAIALGAEAAVNGGFGATLFHKFPDRVPDEPLHSLVVDNEIWTTGVGGGGAGILLGDSWADSVENNSIDVRLRWWEKGIRNDLIVDSVNHGHENKVAAFNIRGGENEIPGVRVHWNYVNGHLMRTEEPIAGKHYTTLRQPQGQWMDWEVDDTPGQGPRSLWGLWDTTVAYQGTEPQRPSGSDVVLESKWKLPLETGQTVSWQQRTGAPTVVSGWPQIIRDGQNVVTLLNMDPEAPHGPDNWFVRKNPRLVIGHDFSGTLVYLVTVEGRIPESRGLRLKELAKFLLTLGVYGAVNFDGGGSAFLWLLEQYINSKLAQTIAVLPPVGELVAPGCYNYSKTLAGLRPHLYSIGVFPR